MGRFRYSDQRVIAEKDRGAIAPALNRCYEHASGEIVCVLDSDDVFAPTKIEGSSMPAGPPGPAWSSIR